MPRGIARAPSQNAYRGSVGRTQTAIVHVTNPRGDLIAAQVYTTIDAVSDPELVDRMHSDDPARAINVVRIEGADPVRVSLPIVYHDPAAEVLVLVLGDAHRHRELDERIRLYERLRSDDAAVPAYAKEFAVVYGASGLRAYLEQCANEALDAARLSDSSRETERRRTELATRDAELEASKLEIERLRLEVEHLRAEAHGRVIAPSTGPDPDPGPGHHEIDRTMISHAPIERDELTTTPVTKHAELDPRSLESAPAALPAEHAAGPAAAGALELPPRIINGRASAVSIAAHAKHAQPSVAPAPADAFEHDVPTGVLVVATPPVNGAGHAAAARVEVEVDEVNIELDEETSGLSSSHAIVPQGSDPLTTTTTELDPPLAFGSSDPWLEDATVRLTSSFAVRDGAVHLVLVANDQIARGLGGIIDVRVLMHRTPTYPLITVVCGPPAALRVPSPTQLVVVPLDIASDLDREVLTALASCFEITVDIVVRAKRVRRVMLNAPLADNVSYLMRAADDHLRALASEGEPSFDRASDLVLAPGHDVLGCAHPDAAEFRDDKLAQLESAHHLRRAIAMARRFARPAREDYLVCTRGFPLPRWRELRRHVLESAVTWGLWMGPELAQVAVSEGLARSRRDLVVRLDRGFEALRRHPTAFDLDAEAADDNYKALADEARALAVELKASKPNGAIVSEESAMVSGSIGDAEPIDRGGPASLEELIAKLQDESKQARLIAAIELCDRGEGRAAEQVITAAAKMSRADAVRVLGMAVKLGDAAVTPLRAGLASSKGFFRHGCALALALLRTEEGTQAVIELLLTEPTEIWREVARAIGQIGPTALMALASKYGRLGDQTTPLAAERVAWAMAHVGVRGGRPAIETMAGGQSVVAPVAKHALELIASAANDHVRVRPGAEGSQAGRDITVNRAFSRRFFEALEQGLPDAGAAALTDMEASSQMEMLDEADLIEEEDEAELDESDLIQA